MATTFKKLISLMAYDATLTEDPNDFYLRAKTMPQSIDLRALADEVAQRLGRNADDIFTVLNAAETVKTDAVASGYIVSTPTALIRPSASGTVQKADLSQPVDRTRVRVYATPRHGRRPAPGHAAVPGGNLHPARRRRAPAQRRGGTDPRGRRQRGHPRPAARQEHPPDGPQPQARGRRPPRWA